MVGVAVSGLGDSEPRINGAFAPATAAGATAACGGPSGAATRSIIAVGGHPVATAATAGDVDYRRLWLLSPERGPRRRLGLRLGESDQEAVDRWQRYVDGAEERVRASRGDLLGRRQPQDGNGQRVLELRPTADGWFGLLFFGAGGLSVDVLAAIADRAGRWFVVRLGFGAGRAAVGIGSDVAGGGGALIAGACRITGVGDRHPCARAG
jgi:hypothetical protein